MTRIQPPIAALAPFAAKRHRKNIRLSVSLLLSTALLLSAYSASARERRGEDRRPEGANLVRIATIPIPGTPLKSFDISWVDPVTELYFFSDRSNKAVDIFDAANDAFLRRVDSFAGPSTANSTAGPNGVVSVGPTEVWAGDGNSTMKIIDLTTNTIVKTISTGGVDRVDEMAFNGRDHLVLAANDADTPPFLTLLDTETRTIVTRVNIPGAVGIEQSVWDNTTGLFYVSIPQVGPDPTQGEIAIIDTRGLVVGAIPVANCSPTGLAVGPDHHLVVGCDDPVTLVISTKTREVVARINEVGGADEVWFNPGDRNYYIAARNNPAAQGGPVLGVINAETNEFAGSIPTEPGAHSVAANPRNNHVFLPLDAGKDPTNNPACVNGCIGVYKVIDKDDDEIADRRGMSRRADR